MKTIFRIRPIVKHIRKVWLMLLLTATILSCSKEDQPEMEASLLTDNLQELVLGKWYVNLAQSEIASHCLAQYYLEFHAEEVKNMGSFALIDDQSMLLGTAIPLTKICELPDETSYGYSWANDQNLSVMIDSREVTLSIIAISKTLLILNNEATGKMLVLKKGS